MLLRRLVRMLTKLWNTFLKATYVYILFKLGSYCFTPSLQQMRPRFLRAKAWSIRVTMGTRFSGSTVTFMFQPTNIFTGYTTQVVTKEIKIPWLLEHQETWGWSYFVAYESCYLFPAVKTNTSIEAPNWRGIFQIFAKIFWSCSTLKIMGIMKEISVCQMLFKNPDYETIIWKL